MPIQLGNFQLPTIGDAIHGGEAILGNLVEGIIEGVSGQRVELTPGVGVDNTAAKGPKGKGDIVFDKKMASHDDVERLRRELEKELTAVRTDLAKMKLKARVQKPAVQPPIPQQGLQQQPQGMNPMMMLMLSRRDGEMQHDPLLMMMLMQQMGSQSIGTVNGQQLHMDPMAFATMQMFASALNPPPRVIRATPKPLHILPQPTPPSS